MAEKFKNTSEQTFESAFDELQSILKELNVSQVPLNLLVEKYSRARECLKFCRERLGEAELQVKKLAKDGLESFDDKKI